MFSASFYRAALANGFNGPIVAADYLDVLATSLGTPNATTGEIALPAGAYLITAQATSSASNVYIQMHVGDHQIGTFGSEYNITTTRVLTAAGVFKITVSNGSGADFDASGGVTIVQL